MDFESLLKVWAGLRISGNMAQAEIIWQRILQWSVTGGLTEAQILAAADTAAAAAAGGVTATEAGVIGTGVAVTARLCTKQYIIQLLGTWGDIAMGGGALSKTGAASARLAIRGPLIAGALTLALIATTGCAAQETKEEANSRLVYLHYLKNYLFWANKQRKIHPNAKIAQPDIYEEWYMNRGMMAVPH